MSQVSRMRNIFNNAVTSGLNGQAAKMALDYVKSERPNKRKSIEQGGGSTRKKRVVSRPYRGQNTDVVNQSSKSSRNAAVKRGKAFRKKNAGGKNIKVPKKLKQQIQKVLSVSGHKGVWTQISYGFIEVPESNFQHVQYGLFGSSSGAGVGSNLDIQSMFSWVDWLHMVSVMWNNKTDKQGVRTYRDEGTLGRLKSDPGAGELNNIPTGLQTNGMTPLTFTVYDSYETLHFKNNSQRTYTIELYLCAPKMAMNETDAAEFDSATGTNLSVPLEGGPLEIWQKCLKAEERTGVNVLGATVNNFATSPNNCPEFKKRFDVELTTIVMDPGQTYTYKVQGPKNLKVDVVKMFRVGATNESYAMELQKWSRCPIFCLTSDLVQTRSGTVHPFSFRPGRFQSVVNGNYAPIVVERVRHATIICPDQVIGAIDTQVDTAIGNVGGAKGNIVATKKQPRYCRPVYGFVADGATNRVDELNPIEIIEA